MLNKSKRTRNEKIEDKKTKRNQREAKLKRELEIEKQKVLEEKAKLEKEIKLHAAERQKTYKLRKELKTATSERTKNKIAKEALKTFVETNFKGKAQQTVLLNPSKKWARCSREDIVEALTLRTFSPKAFQHLQKNGSLYLPSRRTIERHIEKISTCKTG